MNSKDEQLIQIVISLIANIASSGFYSFTTIFSFILLTYVTDEADVKGKVAQEIGFKTLTQFLSHSNADIQKGAAVTFGHYAGQEEYQQVFLLVFYFPLLLIGNLRI